MNWIESAGGPLIVLPRKSVQLWGGADIVHPMENDDYARACAISDWAAVLQVGTENALVLGGDPLPVACVEHGGSLVLLRWVYAESEESILAFAVRELSKAKPEENLLFVASDSHFVIADSAWAGSEFEETLEFHLNPGTYKVETRWLKFAETCAVTHTFRNCQPARRHER